MGSLQRMPMVEPLDFLLRQRSRYSHFMLLALQMVELIVKIRQGPEKGRLVL